MLSHTVHCRVWAVFPRDSEDGDLGLILPCLISRHTPLVTHWQHQKRSKSQVRFLCVSCPHWGKENKENLLSRILMGDIFTFLRCQATSMTSTIPFHFSQALAEGSSNKMAISESLCQASAPLKSRSSSESWLSLFCLHLLMFCLGGLGFSSITIMVVIKFLDISVGRSL